MRFAWPYRIRFGLSLGCAVMVALMGFSTISAVYPLLQILFYHQNCQQWITDKVAETDTAILVLRAQVDEIDHVRKIVLDDRNPANLRVALLARHREAIEEARRKEEVLRQAELDLESHPRAPVKEKLRKLRDETAIASSRLTELPRAMDLARVGDIHGLDQRRSTAAHALEGKLKDMRRLRWVEPFITKYLPSDGFRTLCLLLAMVMGGIAIKGIFQFAQDVLVATITQLSLFDLRNLFFRRTMKLDLASFSDQGSAELMARFTNDIDSVSQGFNTLLSKMVREPLRIISFLGGAFWLNWRLTCLTLIIVPISALATYRVGKTLKRAVRRSLESMSNIYKILQESFQGIRLVKAYTMERHERR
ncbi:MAG TPA: ABC transporter transmembrane domain-containing protein, partial [Isosphaeraceae bacterium]|nr:ABC transporter transmembrane domain-containing protein [Isosphaeraceae bacterium]